MSNEHIGRKQEIGIGKESTSGTSVSASVWFPKMSGAFKPKFVIDSDKSAWGTIAELREDQTVQQTTEVTLTGIARDISLGHLLMAAFGSSYPCVRFNPASITGTFVEGETVTESTSSATGTLRRLDSSTTPIALYIEPLSGTFTGGQTLTGGTSGATCSGGTIQSPSALRDHVFRMLNNNTHPSYTIYNHDAIGDEKAVYCMLDQLDVEIVSGKFITVTAKYIGKKLTSASAQTPSYTTTTYALLPKHANFYFSALYSGIASATATAISRVKFTIKKNTEVYQAIGSTDVNSIHNKQWSIEGMIELLYTSVTQRDYVVNSTKQAARIVVANTDATIGSSANPTFQLDIPKCAFKEWDRTSDNDALVKQTLSFSGEYDTGRSLVAEAVLRNTQVSSY